MINRFQQYRPTQVVQQYVPTRMDADLYNQALQRAQQGYDQALMGIGSFTPEFNYYSGDRDIAKERFDYYETQKNNLINELTSNGDFRTAARNMLQLGQEYQKDKRTGDISNLEARYAYNQSQLEALEDVRKKDPNLYNQLYSHYLDNRHTDFRKNGQLNPMLGDAIIGERPDYAKAIDMAVGNLKADGMSLGNGQLLRMNGNGDFYVYANGKNEYISREKALATIDGVVGRDPNIQQFLGIADQAGFGNEERSNLNAMIEAAALGTSFYKEDINYGFKADPGAAGRYKRLNDLNFFPGKSGSTANTFDKERFDASRKDVNQGYTSAVDYFDERVNNLPQEVRANAYYAFETNDRTAKNQLIDAIGYEDYQRLEEAWGGIETAQQDKARIDHTLNMIENAANVRAKDLAPKVRKAFDERIGDQPNLLSDLKLTDEDIQEMVRLEAGGNSNGALEYVADKMRQAGYSEDQIEHDLMINAGESTKAAYFKYRAGSSIWHALSSVAHQYNSKTEEVSEKTIFDNYDLAEGLPWESDMKDMILNGQVKDELSGLSGGIYQVMGVEDPEDIETIKVTPSTNPGLGGNALAMVTMIDDEGNEYRKMVGVEGTRNYMIESAYRMLQDMSYSPEYSTENQNKAFAMFGSALTNGKLQSEIDSAEEGVRYPFIIDGKQKFNYKKEDGRITMYWNDGKLMLFDDNGDLLPHDSERGKSLAISPNQVEEKFGRLSYNSRRLQELLSQ